MLACAEQAKEHYECDARKRERVLEFAAEMTALIEVHRFRSSECPRSSLRLISCSRGLVALRRASVSISGTGTFRAAYTTGAAVYESVV